MIQRPTQAIACLREAVEASPDLFEARLELALLYERRHQLEDAAEQVEALLSQRPSSHEVRFVAGRVARRRGESDDAEHHLHAVAKDDKAHWVTRSQAWSEIAQLCDENAEYDRAFDAACQAKQIAEPQAKSVQSRADVEARAIENLHAELTSEYFERWRRLLAEQGWPQERLTLLTGAPRSGTTLLEKVLDSHPDITTSDEQEAFPKFILPAVLARQGEDKLLYASNLDEVPADRWLAQRERYSKYIADAMGESLLGRMLIDKNPSMIMLIPGMLRLFPECKVIVALRDPRDVIVSCFLRYLPLNTVSVQFLSIEGTARRYLRDMEAWFRLKEMISSPHLEVRYEDTVSDLPGEARRTLKFLGLDWNDVVLTYRDQLHSKQVNSPTYEAVAKPVYSSAIGRWKHYQRHLGPALDLVEPMLDRLGYS